MKKLLSLIVAIGLMFVLSITAFADDKCSYTPVEELPIDEASGRKIITDYRQFSDIYTKGISGKYILDNSDPYGKGKFNNQFTAEGHYEDSLVFYASSAPKPDSSVSAEIDIDLNKQFLHLYGTGTGGHICLNLTNRFFYLHNGFVDIKGTCGIDMRNGLLVYEDVALTDNHTSAMGRHGTYVITPDNPTCVFFGPNVLTAIPNPNLLFAPSDFLDKSTSINKCFAFYGDMNNKLIKTMRSLKDIINYSYNDQPLTERYELLGGTLNFDSFSNYFNGGKFDGDLIPVKEGMIFTGFKDVDGIKTAQWAEPVTVASIITDASPILIALGVTSIAAIGYVIATKKKVEFN